MYNKIKKKTKKYHSVENNSKIKYQSRRKYKTMVIKQDEL